MSMQTDCVYGYGFHIYASDEQLRGFILKHKETLLLSSDGRRLLEYEKEHPGESFNPKEDFYDWTSEINGAEGLYGMIADVMHKETGITFEYVRAQDADEDDAILLAEMYPWQMNAREKNLSMDEIENICKMYIADLGGQLEPGFVRLEFFG